MGSGRGLPGAELRKFLSSNAYSIDNNNTWKCLQAAGPSRRRVENSRSHVLRLRTGVEREEADSSFVSHPSILDLPIKSSCFGETQSNDC